VTFFDADAAGQKAAERAAELLEPSDGGAAWAINRTGAFETGAPFRLKVALLPPGHDPDTFLREYGAAALTSRIEAARSLLGYALDRAVADPDGATGARARATAFARVALMLAKVGDAEEAVALSREAAAKLGVDPTQLWIEAQRLQSALRKPGAAPRPAPTSAGRAEDRALVRLLLHHDAARPALLPLIEESELGGEAVRAIVAALKASTTRPVACSPRSSSRRTRMAEAIPRRAPPISSGASSWPNASGAFARSVGVSPRRRPPTPRNPRSSRTSACSTARGARCTRARSASPRRTTRDPRGPQGAQTHE